MKTHQNCLKKIGFAILLSFITLQFTSAQITAHFRFWIKEQKNPSLG